MSLTNEEAKIEHLIRQLATISPPFVNSREELKQLSAALYLLSDQLENQTTTAEKTETIIDLPPIGIPENRPIFADHSNPVPHVSEESIEEELQLELAPKVGTHTPPPQPAENNTSVQTDEQITTPEIQAVSTEAPVVTPEIRDSPMAEPKVVPPDVQQAPVTPDLFAQPEAKPVNAPEIPQEKQAPIAPEVVEKPVQSTPPASVPEPVIPAAVPVEPQVSDIPVNTPPAPPTASPQATPPIATPTERDLQRALPLVRRLEFINRLFNGNDSEWQRFCQDVNRSYSTSDALQIYRESYIRYSWEKHAEMADLLKQLIVKTFG